MGKFIAGFVISSVLFFGFALTYATQESRFVDAACTAGDSPSEIYIADAADRDLVCKYLRREVGLDQ